MVQPTNRFTLARTRGQCHRRATAPAESRDGKTAKRDNRQTSTTTDKDNNTHKERTIVRQTYNNNNTQQQQRDNTQCQYISYTKLTVRGTTNRFSKGTNARQYTQL